MLSRPLQLSPTPLLVCARWIVLATIRFAKVDLDSRVDSLGVDENGDSLGAEAHAIHP